MTPPTVALDGPAGWTATPAAVGAPVRDLALRTARAPQGRVAARFHPIDALALGPQCRLASTAPDNLLDRDDERRKLELVVSVADEVWGSAWAT